MRFPGWYMTPILALQVEMCFYPLSWSIITVPLVRDRNRDGPCSLTRDLLVDKPWLHPGPKYATQRLLSILSFPAILSSPLASSPVISDSPAHETTSFLSHLWHRRPASAPSPWLHACCPHISLLPGSESVAGRTHEAWGCVITFLTILQWIKVSLS